MLRCLLKYGTTLKIITMPSTETRMGPLNSALKRCPKCSERCTVWWCDTESDMGANQSCFLTCWMRPAIKATTTFNGWSTDSNAALVNSLYTELTQAWQVLDKFYKNLLKQIQAS